ncbi:MAG TPA: endo-1,4-beta-xylanase [Acetobacteraceae bacterium]|nr:endo-1,4-beta-xylanase [Acetobacteraceae bacterium]
MRRREFLKAATSASATPTVDVPLRDLAAARHIRFGTEATWRDLAQDPAYARLVAHECAILTPGIEAKWPVVEPSEGEFQFGDLDRIVAFAQRNALALHMHNLVWAVGLPSWTLTALTKGRGTAVMARHIAATVGRYRGHVDSWDVVNEPIDPRWPSGPEGLCTTPWRRALGPDYVPDALCEARAADGGARLLINDDDLEYDAPDREQKRTLYLRLIENWLKRGVPLTGFGLEAHIKPWLRIAEQPYRRFLRELASFGLILYVTEFDVCDRTLPGDIDARDRAVAWCAKNYLDLVLDEPAVKVLITWGLADNTSWMSRDPAARRADGLAPRPLPYDARLRAKPMRNAIAAALRAAPCRSA